MQTRRTRASLLLILPFILLFLAGSCVSNRKVTFLQYEDELKADEITTDSIVRRYENGELRYKLQPNDVLNIKIASQTPEEYNPFAIADPYITSASTGGMNLGQGAMSNIGYRVDPAGYLNLPVVGEINVQGMTVEELETLIDTLAMDQLEDPVTKIALMNFRFSVLGEVMTEGLMISQDNSMTMLQAIAMAGGPDEFGDLSRVKIIRRLGDQNMVFYVNLLDEDFLESDFYQLYPNDVLVVSPLPARPYFKYVAPNLSIIASSVSLVASLIALFAIFGASS